MELDISIETDAEWLTDPAVIASTLYELDRHESIAVQVERSYGTSTMYVTVESGPFPDARNYSETTLAEPYDVVLKGEERRSPSADHADSVGISYDPDEEIVYLKTGVGHFEKIEAVTLDTMAVNYDANVSVAAKCDECGQTTTLPVRERDDPITGPRMVEGDSDLLTPCCRSSDWTTTLATE
ncbi:hypothetical protein HLRTI_002901 [Halorhabdus tiamatea SARL4B]|uniref:Uncharacterized protein n=1 Tax=Halorhabdus tiamatea SARL4B TaxID=1033806 RepID=U2DGG0_9EURY|nr:hypothetical protein [Halorhabdus tiamatea]ERJ05102.1 hypothetical protein HLRTI_002901 [Halorhabdus tiamatea SARL4B]